MNLVLEPHAEQLKIWPKSGRHILAQFDDQTIVVYQAYRPSIGKAAAANGKFGVGFSLERMTWLKPNCLWMMYRSGWASKVDQETVLAIRLRRAAFDAYLAQAVHSSFAADRYGDHSKWTAAVAASEVRLQWDPDHSPSGAPLERRAIQLGLRGGVLQGYVDSDIVSIEDITEFVLSQSAAVEQLVMPRERAYPVSSGVARKLGVVVPEVKALP